MYSWLRQLPGIYITAAITSIMVVVIFLVITSKSSVSRRAIWFAFLFNLPLSPLLLYFVRLPIHRFLHQKPAVLFASFFD